MVLKEKYRPIFQLIFLYSDRFLSLPICCSPKKWKVKDDIGENQIQIFPSFSIFKGNLPLLNVFFRDIFACILYFQKYYQHCHSHSLSGIARVLLLISIFIKAYFTPSKSFLQPFFLLIFSLPFLPLVNFFSSNFFLVLYSFASLLPPQSFDQRARVFLLLVTCVQRLWLVMVIYLIGYNNLMNSL